MCTVDVLIFRTPASSAEGRQYRYCEEGTDILTLPHIHYNISKQFANTQPQDRTLIHTHTQTNTP